MREGQQPWASPLLAPESTRKFVSTGFGSGGPPGLSAYKPQLRCSPALHPICATRPGELCPPNSGGSPRSLFLPGFPGPAPSPPRGSGRGLGPSSHRPRERAEGRLEEDERQDPQPAPAPGLWVRGGAPPGWRQSERPTQDPCRSETGAGVWGVLCSAPLALLGGGEGARGPALTTALIPRAGSLQTGLVCWEGQAECLRVMIRSPHKQASSGGKQPPDLLRLGEVPARALGLNPTEGSGG